MSRDNEYSRRKYFPFYHTWDDTILNMTDEEAGILIKMICRYDKEDIKPERPDREKDPARYTAYIIVSGWFGNLDSAREHFAKVSENNSRKPNDPGRPRTTPNGEKGRERIEGKRIEGDGIEEDGKESLEGNPCRVYASSSDDFLSLSDMDEVVRYINDKAGSHWGFKAGEEEKQKEQLYDVIITESGCQTLEEVKEYIDKAWQKSFIETDIKANWSPFNIFRLRWGDV